MQLLDLAGAVDCAIAVAVVQMPSAGRFFKESAGALKEGGRLLLAEPADPVTEADFEEELKLAGEARIQADRAARDSPPPSGAVSKVGALRPELLSA